MGRFDLNLTEVSDTRIAFDSGVYKYKVAGGKVREGIGKNSGEPYMNFSLELIVLDPAVCEFTGMDEPRVFFQGMVGFKKTGDQEFDKNNSPELGQLIKVMDYDKMDLEDFADGAEEAETWREFMKVVIQNMIDGAVGGELMGDTVKELRYNSETEYQNIVKRISKVTE
jgi:hypothetical protein